MSRLIGVKWFSGVLYQCFYTGVNSLSGDVFALSKLYSEFKSNCKLNLVLAVKICYLSEWKALVSYRIWINVVESSFSSEP